MEHYLEQILKEEPFLAFQSQTRLVQLWTLELAQLLDDPLQLQAVRSLMKKRAGHAHLGRLLGRFIIANIETMENLREMEAEDLLAYIHGPKDLQLVRATQARFVRRAHWVRKLFSELTPAGKKAMSSMLTPEWCGFLGMY